MSPTSFVRMVFSMVALGVILCLCGCQSELEGTWKGKAYSTVREDTRTYEMVFSGAKVIERRFTAEGPIETLLDGVFYLDSNADPKEIEIEIQLKVTGVVKGIYKIDGDKLYYAPSTSSTGTLPTADQLDPSVSRFVLVLDKQEKSVNKILDLLSKCCKNALT